MNIIVSHKLSKEKSEIQKQFKIQKQVLYSFCSIYFICFIYSFLFLLVYLFHLFHLVHLFHSISSLYFLYRYHHHPQTSPFASGQCHICKFIFFTLVAYAVFKVHGLMLFLTFCPTRNQNPSISTRNRFHSTIYLKRDTTRELAQNPCGYSTWTSLGT